MTLNQKLATAFRDNVSVELSPDEARTLEVMMREFADLERHVQHLTPEALAANGLPVTVDREKLLREALTAQHKWHLSQTAPDEFGTVPADEYQDSALCEQTLAALSGAAR